MRGGHVPTTGHGGRGPLWTPTGALRGAWLREERLGVDLSPRAVVVLRGVDPGVNPEGKTVISLTGSSTTAGHASVERTGALHTTNLQDVIDVIAPDP